MIFSHIIIGARDLDRLAAFYDAVLLPLGLERGVAEDDGGPAGHVWLRPNSEWPQFWIQHPFDGLPATWGNGTQVSFAVSTRDAVDAAWQAALDHSGISEGAPALRERYGPDYYGAYVRDPEGNKLCFVHTKAFES